MSSTQAPDKTKGVAGEKLALCSVRHLIRVVGRNACALHLTDTWRYFRQLNGLEVSATYFAMVGGCL